MKAWIVSDLYDEYSTVVFAETRNKAKVAALSTDVCEDMSYIEIRPIRFKEADDMYEGRYELDWREPKARRFLVDHGWSCVEFEPDMCEDCPANDICEKYKDYLTDLAEEDNDYVS